MKKTCPLCGAEYDSAQTFCSKDGAVLKVGAAASGDLTGSVLADRYRIVKRLGEGGMGTVFLAEHVKIGRRSALKVVKPDMAADPDAIARFIREATNASKIEHPNVAGIHDFGELADGRLYLAMEFIDGESLAAVLHREGPMPPFRAAEIVAQVSAGLQAAHQLGIVHRDLKPENIMLARHPDGSDKVKLVDFGIAKAHGDAGQKVTRTGVLIGTPAYMSPEQVAGGEVSGASDQFALACSAFEMLTGALPFEGDNTFEQITSRVAGRARRLAQVRADIAWAPVLQDVLMQGLETKPADRYPSMTAFSAAFSAAVRATPGAMPALSAPPATLGSAAPQRPSARTVATGPRAAAAELPVTRVISSASKGRVGVRVGVAALALALALAGAGFGAWQWSQSRAGVPLPVADSAARKTADVPSVVAGGGASVTADSDAVATAPAASTATADSLSAAGRAAAATRELKRPAVAMPERTPTPAPVPTREASRQPVRASDREPVREPESATPAPSRPARPSRPSRPSAGESGVPDSVAVATSRARARQALATGDTARACRELSGALEKAEGNRRLGALIRLNLQNLGCPP
ncbi:MAG: protein kinase domain-containing protein [Gemmatimonadota bacterium]|jgi:serine/threonine-protein kinase